MDELVYALNAHMDQVADLVEKLTVELRSGLRPAYENFVGFFHAVDWKVAIKNNDPQLTFFIQSNFLSEQVDAIKKISESVAQLRRVGKGNGVWHFDQMLLREEVA